VSPDHGQLHVDKFLVLASVGTRSSSFYIYIIFKIFNCYLTSNDLMARELSLLFIKVERLEKSM